jgi:tetratricopeptide (TPR) repeat protein
MTRVWIWAGAVAFALTACQQVDKSLLAEDQTNLQFQTATKALGERNFTAAADAYEKALQANPQNATAHYELGQLYGDRLGDPIQAMYHYQAYLKLRPAAENHATVEQLLVSQKTTFAAAVAGAPAPTEELNQLQQQNADLRQKLDEALAKLSQTATAPPAGPASAALPPAPEAPAGASSSPAPSGPSVIDEVVAAPAATAVPAASRTHTVEKGDNLWKIAKKYYAGNIMEGIDKIKKANPEANPQNLKIGTPIVIP